MLIKTGRAVPQLLRGAPFRMSSMFVILENNQSNDQSSERKWKKHYDTHCIHIQKNEITDLSEIIPIAFTNRQKTSSHPEPKGPALLSCEENKTENKLN
jgi:hypothetical protein